ncbi:ChiQ/YbfN family lipoprotein [Citrobacter freundii]|uniref:ChiQ/YbfN family lipoprotein n=1 Tax=Citrobacter freundii TaxID=546 RepID=UPI00177AB934|nr:ChiQ/YbfN family lipoprotein [Citrobacter freundii]MBD9989535.1 hypothetical protein [Citrobacter freundii]MBE0054807.1 hypothetical protein [Citrobacter freundii]MDT7289164.1 ChiQ/YbfN family lipoprotein [Citrobacter freundii]MDT7299690.1 ChiQ/YbfN family lipoprotein [Citrobacter freundii]HBU6168441.1 hypothetical protein [Citrobacter freundii]
MKKYLTLLLPLLLAGCSSTTPTEQTHSNSETISPMEYQECIQAAMTGNGQAYSEKCDQILKDSR